MTEAIDNAPFRSHRHGNLTIEGYSRAGIQSYWHIPELKVGFDFGAAPWAFRHTSDWFLSHVHLDHITALPAFIARRMMMKLGPPHVHLPEESREDVRRLLRIVQRLDCGKQRCKLTGMKPGDNVPLGSNHFVMAFATSHTVPSLGYLVYEVRQKLRIEFQGRAGGELADLRDRGVTISEPQYLPVLAYTGDTSPEGLDSHPDILRARVLITEMSFVRPHHVPEKVHSYGHMHMSDFIKRADRFENELIILGHFSTRYEEAEIHDTLAKHVPSELFAKMKIWL